MSNDLASVANSELSSNYNDNTGKSNKGKN